MADGTKAAPLREAASVILLRRGAPFEVFLLRRKKNASFMANAYVFPGGGADPGEDARVCAARELFEEAGVLLACDAPRDSTSGMAHTPDGLALGATLGRASSLADLRRRVLAGVNATDLLARSQLRWWTDLLIPWAHWITPSRETRRFSARFFVCEMPGGQRPSFDGDETVDQAWVTPADAIARAAELALPPPQLRTMHELAQLGSIDAVLAAAKARADEPHPILPRLRGSPATPGDSSPTLLLPWDREYVDAGTGDAAPLTYVPAWAVGPSRFVWEDHAWKHVDAPTSTTAG